MRFPSCADRHSKRVAGVVVGLFAWGVVMAGVAPGQTLPAASTTAEPWTVERVLDMIDWREAALRKNCSFKCYKEVWCGSLARPEIISFSEKIETDVAASGGKLRFIHSLTYPNARQASFKNQKSVWDGRTTRYLYTEPNKDGDQVWGRIEGLPPNVLKDEQLLFLTALLPKPSTAPSLRKNFETHEFDFAVEQPSKENGNLVVLKATQGGTNPNLPFTVCITSYDPAKDFVMVENSYRYSTLRRDPLPKFADRTTVDDFDNSGGLWIGRHASLVQQNEKGQVVASTGWRIEGFSRKPVDEKEFVISYPPQAKVMDTVTNTYYEIQDDDSRRYLEFYNTTSRRVISPDEQAEAALTQPSD